MKILVEKKFGTGAVRNKVDLRDRKWKKVAKAVTPFDWEKGYDIEEELSKKLGIPGFRIPVKDQNGSFSCCGQAAAYYESVQDAFEKGVFIERSARDAYSQIFYPEGGGSSIRDTVNLMTKKGVCKEAMMVSYENGRPPGEGFMRNRLDANDTTKADALTAKGTAYASVASNIDEYAQAIQNCHGLVFCVDGQNNGTWLTKFPKPPTEMEWRHALYAGKAKLIKGKKYIGILNSWGEECGERGWQWIGEDYFARRMGGFMLDSANVVYDSTNDVLKAKISLLERVLELLQKLWGTETKKVI